MGLDTLRRRVGLSRVVKVEAGLRFCKGEAMVVAAIPDTITAIIVTTVNTVTMRLTSASSFLPLPLVLGLRLLLLLSGR